MKKIICLIAAASTILASTACGSSKTYNYESKITPAVTTVLSGETISESDLYGIWSTDTVVSNGNIYYLYFDSSGVYWSSAKKGVVPKGSDFTSQKAKFRIATSFSIRKRGSSDFAYCEFGSKSYSVHIADDRKHISMKYDGNWYYKK